MQQTTWQLGYLTSEQFTTPEQAITAVSEWRPADVPGNIQTSPFGLPIPELYWRDNVNSVRWMEEMYWVYRTPFPRPTVGEGEEAIFLFLGVDYQAHFLLNGKLVASHEGMFAPVEIPLDQCEDENELAVVIEPFSAEKRRDCAKPLFSWGNATDFGPQFQVRGIWQEAGVVVRPRLHVTRAWVQTRLDNQQRADCLVNVELSEPVAMGEITVELDGVRRNFPVVNTGRLALPLNIPSPTLWWPNGMGEPALVELHLDLAVEGRQVPSFACRVGLRSIERIACPGQGVEDIPLQLIINGRKVFLKGVNWVPVDGCPGNITDDRYQPLLSQFHAANVNIIRIWGGGIMERQAFYDLADELGLMVLQEFPFFGNLVRTPHFYRIVEQEVGAIIRALSHHPSIVIWSGGNEHYHYWDNLDSGSERMEVIKEKMRAYFKFDNREWRGGVPKYDEPGLALMGHLSALLDGSRLYQITSGMEGEGEVHGIWTWNPAIGDQRYRDSDTLYDYWLGVKDHLFSEASVSSIANLETIKQVLQETTPAFPTPDDPTWRLHKAFGAAWDGYPHLWLDIPSTEELFGPMTDLETLVLANQWMQGEGARFLIEELRRKMPHTCGIIWWGINEPWPGLAGNFMIDYFGRPKLGMQFMANAYKPTILSLRYRHCVARRIKPELWISHDGREAFSGRFEVEVRNLANGEVDRYAGNITCDPYASQFIRNLLPLRLPAGTRAHIQCRLYNGEEVVHRNDYLFASNEDVVPFDAGMLGLIKELYTAVPV